MNRHSFQQPEADGTAALGSANGGAHPAVPQNLWEVKIILCTMWKYKMLQQKRGVALTGRNTTDPPWSVGRPTAGAPGPPACRQRYSRRQTPDSKTILAH